MIKAKPTATNCSREQIEQLGEFFASKTGYVPGEGTDIFKYVESLGGTVKYSDSNTDSAGGAIDVDGPGKFTIYLSRLTPPERDVFTIAHELGHYVLHSKMGKIPLLAGRSGSKEQTEKEANSFAAGFLMPEEQFRAAYKKERYILDMAKKFGVSLSAAEWRRRNLGLR